jgi:hypothetical protein
MLGRNPLGRVPLGQNLDVIGGIVIPVIMAHLRNQGITKMFLRQSTASQEISLGSFLDTTDGNTEETGLTIANTDIKIRKGGGTTLVNKNSGGATHIANGVYSAVIDATDTDTLGDLVIYCHPTGALATKLEYTVLPAASYDALIVNGLNDISSAQVNTQVDTALTDYDGPTNAEMIARTLVAASYFDPATDAVANVTLVGTTTTNTDMRGTNSALPASSYTAPDNAGITSNGNAISALNNITVTDVLTTQMTESYAADGTAPTLAQAIFLSMQNLQDFSFAGTTQTVKQIDGSTTAATYTLDDAVAPTSKTRAT